MQKSVLHKIKILVFWPMILVYIIMSLSFTEKETESGNYSNISIKLSGNSEYPLFNQDDILKILEEHGWLSGKSLNKLNLDSVEKAINNYPPVKISEIYTTVNDRLFIELEQHNPLVRIFDESGKSLYLCENGQIIHFSGSEIPFLPVLNGHVEKIVNNNFNIFHLSDTTTMLNKNLLTGLHSLSGYLRQDTFWRAQIEQIYVNEYEEFELIPRVGPHYIIFGDQKNIEWKFKKLYAFYIEGLNRIGWNQYKTINVKYSNQVVCTPHE